MYPVPSGRDRGGVQAMCLPIVRAPLRPPPPPCIRISAPELPFPPRLRLICGLCLLRRALRWPFFCSGLISSCATLRLNSPPSLRSRDIFQALPRGFRESRSPISAYIWGSRGAVGSRPCRRPHTTAHPRGGMGTDFGGSLNMRMMCMIPQGDHTWANQRTREPPAL